jgi:hypothetical protein
LALGLVLALGVSGLAFGDGATENTPFVDGAVAPTKLPADKKKPKKVSLFLGVRNQDNITGTQSNPASEEISIGKEVDVSAVADTPVCPATPANGTTPDQAKAACGEGSYLGQGVAELTFPGSTPISDITVSVFHGPAGATPPARAKGISEPLILHTYSPTLQTASPAVQTYLVKSRAGKKFGSTLWVPNTPETGSGLLTKFNATLDKSIGITSYCEDKKIDFLRHTVYKDGSSEDSTLTQKCKPKVKK